jgi:hypothetical protein
MKVRIYQLTKTATQSGKKSSPWFVEPIIEEQHKSNNNLMGWTSSNNTMSQIKLKFSSKEDAIKYSLDQGFEYKIIPTKISKTIKKSYAENFS